MTRAQNQIRLGACGLLMVAACASTPYPAAVLWPNENGKLEGVLRWSSNPAEDTPAADCMPTPQDQAPCVVLRTEIYERMLTDIEELKERLKEKEKQP